MEGAQDLEDERIDRTPPRRSVREPLNVPTQLGLQTPRPHEDRRTVVGPTERPLERLDDLAEKVLVRSYPMHSRLAFEADADLVTHRSNLRVEVGVVVDQPLLVGRRARVKGPREEARGVEEERVSWRERRGGDMDCCPLSGEELDGRAGWGHRMREKKTDRVASEACEDGGAVDLAVDIPPALLISFLTRPERPVRVSCRT